MSAIQGFSARLAMAIARSGKKKGVIAKSVGLTPLSLSRYLKGDRVPHKTVLVALAGELDVSVDYLLGNTQEMTPTAESNGMQESSACYTPDAVALTGLDADDRQTVVRLLDALRSGEEDVRRHLIGQLKIIEQALESRRQQSRKERRDAS
ncbi:MAG: helix-turn-helix domain-containing protein [Nitrospira sp.]|nr:helix-turn-helix domain-containing protein [Nitrospira sp.]